MLGFESLRVNQSEILKTPMKLGIFCFKGSGCAFLIYPAQARIFHSDSPCVLLFGFCTSHRGRVRVQSNCNRPGRIVLCFFAKTCERPLMRLFASRIRSVGETCEHADTRAAPQNASAGVDMFASHRYFNQLSKNDSASKELFSLYLTFRVTEYLIMRRCLVPVATCEHSVALY